MYAVQTHPVQGSAEDLAERLRACERQVVELVRQKDGMRADMQLERDGMEETLVSHHWWSEFRVLGFGV